MTTIDMAFNVLISSTLNISLTKTVVRDEFAY